MPSEILYILLGVFVVLTIAQTIILNSVLLARAGIPILIQDISGRVTTVDAESIELGPPDSIAISTSPSTVKVVFSWKYEGPEPAFFQISNPRGMMQVVRIDFQGNWLKGSSMELKWDWVGDWDGSDKSIVVTAPEMTFDGEDA